MINEAATLYVWTYYYLPIIVIFMLIIIKLYRYIMAREKFKREALEHLRRCKCCRYKGFYRYVSLTTNSYQTRCSCTGSIISLDWWGEELNNSLITIGKD